MILSGYEVEEDDDTARTFVASHSHHPRVLQTSWLHLFRSQRSVGLMVGLFHLGNKGSPAKSAGSTDTVRPHTPPPPYRPDGHDHTVFAATTTTTTQTVTTTTHTTTHFFSLPLWRRRAQQPNGSSPEVQPVPPDELGVRGSLSPARPLKLDKDLPPTPPLEEGSEAVSEVLPTEAASSATPQRGSAEKVRSSQSVVASTSQLPIIQPLLPPSESSQSTAALARAALGLGLPPVMGGAVAGPSSEINSVSFVVHPSPPSSAHTEISSHSPVMRRAQSLYKDREGNGNPSHAEVLEQRRARGLSLGPLLASSPDEKGKGKQKEVEGKSLSRKSSFWSRKRNGSRPATPVNPPSPSKFLQLQALPTLQPLSPFRVDGMGHDTSPGPSSLHLPTTPDLRRRHSDRTPSQTGVSTAAPDASLDSSSSTGARRRRKSNRPQTADGPSSPRAVSSFFPSPPLLTGSPTGMTPSSSQGIEPSPRMSSLRPRSQTNPPLLHRLSMNLFGSSSSAPSPVAPHVIGENYTRSPSTSFSSSRPSLTRQSPKVSVEIPKPRHHEEESPEIYLQRLMEAVSKTEVASVLASSGDEFHTKALRAYLSRFDFNHDPLDVALRRLLMDVGLPRETQQIDRVMEAFAERYRQCHPNLFSSEDHPYILAFSLIMLHTDAFNKSNKRKMTKADYMKNTRLPGVAPEVLDCFYDNIVFAPFIFIEDPLDVNGQRGLLAEGPGMRRLSALNGSPGGHNGSSTTLLGKSSKIDPYYLITRNLLDDLRVSIHPFIPVTSPYYYQGTGGPWQEDKLLRAFATASTVEVPSEHRYMAPPWFGLNVGAGPSATAMVTAPNFSVLPHEVLSLKVTKVGLLMRKDDVLEGGRKAGNRKWKEWSVLLTGSQLLFHRDPLWAQSIQSRLDSDDGVVALNHASMPRPDEMCSVRDAVAVFDRSYTKHENTLRLVMPDGRHLLLQAKDEMEMNEWIACINYASAFKTAGVRMRSLGLSGKDIELTGQAAAISHLRELGRPHPSPRVHTYSGRPGDNTAISQGQQDEADPMSPTTSTVDEPLTPPMENPSRLFKATFDQVKADLASGKEPTLDATGVRPGIRPRAFSLNSIAPESSKPSGDISAPRLSSRSQIIRRKVGDLNHRIAMQQAQLDSDMRFVRNISILTPFQQSTRNRLQAAIQNVAKRIMQVRLDLEKLKCHRDVLDQDLAAEEREWQRTTSIALSAATHKLEIERQRSTPRLTLSTYEYGDASGTSTGSFVGLRTPSIDGYQPHSAAASSYHSALDFAPDSARSPQQDLRPSASFSLELPSSVSLTDISASSSSPNVDSPQPLSSSVRSSADSEARGEGEQSTTSHDQFMVAPEQPDEQAEEWNKTRAAKRVSLVRMPSTLKLFSPKHARDFSQLLSEDSGRTIVPDPLYRTRSTPFNVPVTRTRSDSDAASLSSL